MKTFNLPDLGEGLRAAELVAWHVAAGDHVVADQPLVSVETEKAVVEIPAPHSGHIAKLLVAAGTRVPVGTPLLEFEIGAHQPSAAVVGTLEEAKPRAPLDRPAQTVGERIAAAPAVRARAKELGLDLARVAPTGQGGNVTLADLDRAARSGVSDVDALRGARRAMSLNMARASHEVTPATLTDEADIDAWSESEGVMLRLLRAIIAGCAAEPVMNARFDGPSLSLRLSERIDVGLAVDSPNGLFVPVLRDIAKRHRDALRLDIANVTALVRSRRLSPEDMRAPTITLSNFGAIAGRHASLVVVPPQVAILGAGRIFESCVRAGAAIAMHRTLPLSLTFDHRAATGGEAARFLRAVVDDLRKPG